MEIKYHPRKANIVANAIRRKVVGSSACFSTSERTLLKELEDL